MKGSLSDGPKKSIWREGSGVLLDGGFGDVQRLLQQQDCQGSDGVRGAGVTEIVQDVEVDLHDVFCVVWHGAVELGNLVVQGISMWTAICGYSEHAVHLIAGESALGVVEFVQEFSEEGGCVAEAARCEA
jgi:hypothetical protein